MIKIKARTRLKDTNVDLVAGSSYHFSSKGTWVDWFIPAHADGYSPLPYMKYFHRWLRMPEAKWLSLIGEIGQSSVIQIDIGALIAHNATYKAEKSGRLYCYANDIPGMYWNNWGTIHLNIRRVEDVN